MRRHLHLLATIGIVSMLASACATPTGEPPSPPTRAPGPGPRSLADTVELARADAARRSGAPLEQITVVAAESVTWNDGSLGCPQPDLLYTQALVPGYRIRLRGPGQSFYYHASARGELVLCPPGRAAEPVPRDGSR